MRVLLIGSGGREHALAWHLSRSRELEQLYCWPGNPGTALLGENIEGDYQDPEILADWARKQEIDLTLVGPEAPLVQGLADSLARRGLLALGPGREGARLEGSKSRAKELMQKAGVPTAAHQVVENLEEVEDYLAENPAPYVLKADGLAGGKGVLICEDRDQARREARSILEEERFGSAGKKLVLEEFLEGREASLLALCAGGDFLLLEPSRDHKRLLNGDQGPNTGGMGAYSPVADIPPGEKERLGQEIFRPLLQCLQQEGIDYRGVLYAGLMLTPAGARVLEFNVRFGDPETQALIPRLRSDLLPHLHAAARGKILAEPLQWKEETCLCVNLVAGGYPGSYEKGQAISGLEKVNPSTIIFHAGTAYKGGRLITAGGRVLGVTVLAEDLEAARRQAYFEASKIEFRDKFYRHDLGRE